MTDKVFWEGSWSKFVPQKVEKVMYMDLFEKFLKPNNFAECIEIGCFPGNFLIYFHKRFGYRIYGIDYFDKMELLKRNFQLNGVNEFMLYQEDFLRWETPKKFDFVFSNGFVEHFQNYEEILDKHIGLLKDGGIVFIAIPNFRYLQFFLHKFFDAENLREHNLKVMRPSVLNNFFLKRNLRINYLGYYGGLGFWVRQLEKRKAIERAVIKLVIKIIHLLRKIIKIDSRFFSCYLVCIASKDNLSNRL